MYSVLYMYIQTFIVFHTMYTHYMLSPIYVHVYVCSTVYIYIYKQCLS